MNSLRISFLGPSVFKFLSDSLFVRFSYFVGSCYYVGLNYVGLNYVGLTLSRSFRISFMLSFSFSLFLSDFQQPGT